jgi:hypothetical protein
VIGVYKEGAISNFLHIMKTAELPLKNRDSGILLSFVGKLYVREQPLHHSMATSKETKQVFVV